MAGLGAKPLSEPMMANLLIHACHTRPQWVNTLRPRQNGRHFADDTFKRIFLNENIIISTKNSLKFVPTGLINNIPALVLIMAWRRPGDKPLSEPMMDNLPTHLCVTRPQWVNSLSMYAGRFSVKYTHSNYDIFTKWPKNLKLGTNRY